jgi:hypothetical protein
MDTHQYKNESGRGMEMFSGRLADPILYSQCPEPGSQLGSTLAEE